jgi:hypothetical protein
MPGDQNKRGEFDTGWLLKVTKEITLGMRMVTRTPQDRYTSMKHCVARTEVFIRKGADVL